MVLDLSKGMSLDLTKESDTKFEFGLHWDVSTVGEDVDIDASAFMLQLDSASGRHKLQDVKNAIFFNNLNSTCGSVNLSGDSRDGASEGDDEVITVDTKLIPEHITQVNIYINIFRPAISFSNVDNAGVDVRNADGKTLAVFNMSEQLTDENSLLVGVISKLNGNWSFTARGEGYVVENLNTIVSVLHTEGSN